MEKQEYCNQSLQKNHGKRIFGGIISTIIIAYISHGYFNIGNIKTAVIIGVTLPFTATVGDFDQGLITKTSKSKRIQEI